jgi:hypothetical protein
MTNSTTVPPPAVVVPVKSGWWSKINWATVITIVAALASIWGFDFPPELQRAVESTIVTVGGLVIIITKTYFTKSVTPQAVAMAASPTITASAPLPVATPSQVDALVRAGELPKGTRP